MADRRKCPECGVSVKIENLPAHYARQHPRAEVPERMTEEASEAVRASKVQQVRKPVTLTSGGKRLIVVVAVALAVILVIVIVNPFRPPGPQVGDAAPGFTIANADPAGGSLSLSTYRGSVTVLELMDVDCEVCIREAPVLATVYATYSSRGVRFLSVSLIDWVTPADTQDSIRSFKLNHGTNWPYGMDTNRDVRESYFPGSTGFGTPTTYILDRTGKITAIFRGQAPGGASDYGSAIDKALLVQP